MSNILATIRERSFCNIREIIMNMA